MTVNDPNSVTRSIEFLSSMKKRRSVRSFSNEPVENELLINAIRTAGSAPSGANKQPWYFALIRDTELKQKLRSAAERVESEFYAERASDRWLADLKPFETGPSKPYLTEAPAIIVVFSRSRQKTSDGQDDLTYYPIESTGIAVGFLIAALHNAGLATLTHTPNPMHFLNKLLDLDSTFRPFMLVVTGYPAPTNFVPPITKKPTEEILIEL